MIKLNKQHSLYQDDLKSILSVDGIEKLKGKSFLITGATGLIGVCLIDALMLYNQHGSDIHIFAVGRNMEKAKPRLGEYYKDRHFHFIEQDVRQPLPPDLEVDYIIPLASNTHPLAYSQYPIETIEINTKGAEYALKMADKCNATVLYPSTVEVYGNARGDEPFIESYTGILNLSTARSCYTESKRVSEAMCQSYISENGTKVKIIRLSRIFGPTMLVSDTKASSQFIQKALADEDIVLKSKGEQFYSYTYVADAVSAMLFVLLHGMLGESYNISVKNCNVHLRDFAQICAEVVGKKVIFDLPSEKERKGFSIATQAILDNTKLTQLGWQAHYTMREAITRTLKVLGGR